MRTLALIALLPLTALADTANTTARTLNTLGDGIWEIRHPDAPDGFPQGNTTVIAGDKAVLVVDSCLLPSSAKQDIEQIRKWTQKPVTWLVNTHWHFDHTAGNAAYADAFPGLQIVAHEHTKKMIESFNPGAIARYPGRQQRFEKMLQMGKDQDGKPLTDAVRADLKKSLAGLASVVAEMKGLVQLVPNVVFEHELRLDLGNREVQILFLGRGNTAGDTIVYLPREKLVVAGDLLDHPIPPDPGNRAQEPSRRHLARTVRRHGQGQRRLVRPELRRAPQGRQQPDQHPLRAGSAARVGAQDERWARMPQNRLLGTVDPDSAGERSRTLVKIHASRNGSPCAPRRARSLSALAGGKRARNAR